MSETNKFEEIILPCQDGIQLFGRRYQSSASSTSTSNPPPTHTHRILCWHGWLDNCRSFDLLAPWLVDHLTTCTDDSNHDNVVVDLVALDFPGHGHSSHKSLDGASVVLMDFVYYVHDALQQLQWTKKQPQQSISLIGHSMGAAVSLLYASAFSSSLDHLMLLDSLGPYSKAGVTQALRRHIVARLKGKASPSRYPSLEQAIETRLLTAQAFPGNQYISKEAATALVQGASRIHDDEDGTTLEFLHDPRLHWSSILYLSEDQVQQVYQAVASSSSLKVAIWLANDGMPYPSTMTAQVQEELQPSRLESLPGSHHFHADPESFQAVGNAIVSFLQE